MKKRFLIFLGVSALLVGCQHQITTPDISTTTTESVQKKLNYFQYLVDKYQMAVGYSKSHKNVQTPLSALTTAYDELKQNNAGDAKVIDKNYSDLQILLNWNSDAWETIFTKWADGMSQKYERINHNNFDKQNSLVSALPNTTVNHKIVKWNIFGVTDTSDYDYIIVDAYQDIQNKHLYLFAFQFGQPVILYVNSAVDQLANSNFELTQNQELIKKYTEFVHPNTTISESTDISKKIEDIMRSYTSKKGEHYLMVSPSTQRQYYGLAVPDEILQYAKIDGEYVTFKWDSWIVGDGVETYNIQACYVNESGTEVILFAYNSGKPVILHTVGEPIIQKSTSGAIEPTTVIFEELTDSVLADFFK